VSFLFLTKKFVDDRAGLPWLSSGLI